MNLNQAVLLILLILPKYTSAQDLPADVASVPSSIESSVSASSVEQLTRQLEEKKREISELKSSLERSDAHKISDIRFLKANVLAETATFYVRAGSYGKISASVFEEQNPSTIVDTYQGEGEFHIINFNRLSPAKTYILTVQAVQPSGTHADIRFNMKLDTKSAAILSEKSFRTAAANDARNPTSRFQDEPLRLREDSVALKLITDQDVQIEIKCSKKKSGLTGTDPCRLEKYGEIDLDEVRLAGSDAKLYQNGDEFFIHGLEPDTEYEFSGMAVNSNGVSSIIPFAKTYKTPASPEKLDFDGPLAILFSGNSVSVSWKATVKTEQTKATVHLNLGQGIGIISTAKYEASKEKWVANIPSSGLRPASKPFLANAQSAASSDLLLTVEMSDDETAGNSVKREFSISVEQSSGKLSLADTETVNSLVQAIAPKAGSGKVIGLIKSGLPLVMALLAL